MAGRNKATLRTFTALYPPPEAARNWLDAIAALDLPPHRPVPVEQIHLTLLFIGDLPSRELPDSAESITRACAGLSPFSLTPTKLIALPDDARQPTRLIATETDAPPTLLELQRRLARRLSRRRSKRPYRPHLTLCRFNEPTEIDSLDRPLAEVSFDVRRIALMHSSLSPHGARHSLVQEFELD